MALNSVVRSVTESIIARSAERRRAYLERVAHARQAGPLRHRLDCSNLAHGMAACHSLDKLAMQSERAPNIAIVSSYNDLLSAHQPLGDYPRVLKEAISARGGVAQFAGGVPAMCDGVTQGAAGMELSLFSRDVIAMSVAIALSHDLFDGVLCLGVCDKIVPGLLMGALSFGHLPVVFVPAGPMTTGLSNEEKRAIRVRYAKGEVDRKALLEAESKAYHGPGTCTFYGTANSNQMLMEIMGLHLPGASFPNPGTRLREALTRAAGERVLDLTALGAAPTPLAAIVSEKAIVNAIVGLHATGGSTNHTIHVIAMARAAGIEVTWDDFAQLSQAVPGLTRIYPNGMADVNAFHAAGGMGYLIGQLLDGGLLHDDVETVVGHGLSRYREELVLADPTPDGKGLELVSAPPLAASLDRTVLAPIETPFSPTGGIMVLDGNLGRAVTKISAVKPDHWLVEAPARCFDSQEALHAAFEAGELYTDVIAVVRFQGPRANGMPELHKLTPALSVILERGFQVGLVTDGRMSGASGKVPAAIHVTPECAVGGPLARIVDGDRVRLDARAGRLDVLVDADTFAARPLAKAPPEAAFGLGRELFALFRENATGAETGASLVVR